MQYTYDSLLASGQNYCIDNSETSTVQSYATEFPNIVQLSEMLIIKDLNLSVFDTVATGTMTAGSQNVTKPSDFIAIQDFFIFVGGSRIYLQQRTKSFMDNYWPNSGSVAQPRYFGDNTTTLWQVVATPDQNYSYQVNYIARPTPMSPTNQTTWIGDKLGECLFYATMLGSMPYFREDVVVEQRLTETWKMAYQYAIAQALKELSPLVSGKDNLTFPLTKRVNNP